MTQIKLFIRQKKTQRQREQTFSCKRAKDVDERLGVWDQKMQTIVYRMEKQQRPTAQHREPHSESCDKPYRI